MSAGFITSGGRDNGFIASGARSRSPGGEGVAMIDGEALLLGTIDGIWMRCDRSLENRSSRPPLNSILRLRVWLVICQPVGFVRYESRESSKSDKRS